MNYTNYHVKLLYWNCNSLLNYSNKIYELYNFIEENHIDICCLSETILDENMLIPARTGFVNYRLDRPKTNENQRTAGGVAIIIRRDLKHTLLSLPNTKLIEAIGVKIYTNRGAIDVFSVYLPGGANRNDIQRHFKNDIQTLTRRHNSYFILGDFNSKHRSWNCRLGNQAGNILYAEQQQGDFIVFFPPTPTHEPFSSNATPSTIDLALSNGLHQISDLRTHDTIDSDHRLVSFELLLDQSPEQRPQNMIPIYQKADWEKYKNCVHRELINEVQEFGDQQHVESTTEVDRMIEKFTKTMLDAKKTAIPMARPRGYTFEIPDVTLDKIRERRRLRRNAQRYPALREELMPEIRALQREIRQEISEVRNENFNHMLSEIPTGGDHRKLWQTTKFLKNRHSFMPPLKHDNKILVTAEEKSNVLANQFAANFENPLKDTYKTHTRQVDRAVAQFMENSVNDVEPEFVNFDELSFQIRRLKNNKAPGDDQIGNRLLKSLPRTGILYFLMIVNSCLQLTYFPSAWKHAKMIAIKKPEKPSSSPSSYRPVSLLSSPSKVLERIILTRLNNHLEEMEVIPTVQHGFCVGRSTVTQLKLMCNKVKNGFSERLSKSMGLLVMDIEKAFDRVWINGLIFKLIQIQAPAYVIRVIDNFLRGRTYRVSIQGHYSEVHELEFGLPQGAVLSPTLYNVHTYDQPNVGGAETSLFADDTAFHYNSRNCKDITKKLETAARKYLKYLKKWKIGANAEKFQALFFTKRSKKQIPQRGLVVASKNVEWENRVKYLGVVLDKKLTFKQHIEHSLNKATKASRALYSMLNRRSQLDINNKLLLYKVAIRPILTYASPVFCSAAKSHINKLQMFQNKMLRMILDIRWNPETQRYPATTSDIHDQAEIETIPEILEKFESNFMARYGTP